MDNYTNSWHSIFDAFLRSYYDIYQKKQVKKKYHLIAS